MSSKLRQQQAERAATGYRILRSLLFLDRRKSPVPNILHSVYHSYGESFLL
jgi:hypothetical protein